MRALSMPDTVAEPSYEPEKVYETCIKSISDKMLYDRLNLVTNDIVSAAKDYEQKAKLKQLYTILQNNCKNDDVALGEVTKKELTDVYSSHMVGRLKPARRIYDLLLSQAPLGRCPFCGFGQASTLDHYLPKTTYPQFSVLPLNLVPSCKDCNTGKRSAVATSAEMQSLHPYFDHRQFVDDQWLYAEVIQSTPATIRFFVQAPACWDDISKARVQSHFNAFKLADRYAIEAGDQLGCLRSSLVDYKQLLGQEVIRQHLAIEAKAKARQHSNSWQAAMFQALALSDWYCDGGFL